MSKLPTEDDVKAFQDSLRRQNVSPIPHHRAVTRALASAEADLGATPPRQQDVVHVRRALRQEGSKLDQVSVANALNFVALQRLPKIDLASAAPIQGMTEQMAQTLIERYFEAYPHLRALAAPDKVVVTAPEITDEAIEHVRRNFDQRKGFRPSANFVREVIRAYQDFVGRKLGDDTATGPGEEVPTLSAGSPLHDYVQRQFFSTLPKTLTLYLDRVVGGAGDTAERPADGRFPGTAPKAFFRPAYGTDEPAYNLSIPTEQWIALGRPATLEISR